MFGHSFYFVVLLILASHTRYNIQRRRGTRGRSRGRGRNRAGDRGYVPGNGLRENTDNSTENNNNQNNAPKSVRGRGPRRYQPSSKNKEAPVAQNRQ